MSVMRRIFHGIIIAFVVLFMGLAAWPAHAGSPANFMMRARVNGQVLEGLPLSWTKTQMLLLGRDGALYQFDPRKAKESRKTGPRFYGYSIGEMKSELYREFSQEFDLTTTQHYVVAHPHGHGREWASRFENLYRSFGHYFRIRGFQTKDPKYPLVAIVFRNRADYYRYSESQGSRLQPGTLGHYALKTNRVFLYDLTTDGADWSRNADTIIHEATHQMAFNTGVHTRFSGTPLWVAEGLATMFEARGVWDSQSHQTQKDRINRGRMTDFKQFVGKRRKEGFMSRLITTDQAFQSDPSAAYAEAWALSFFLCETRPRRYAKYLALTADRKMLTSYSDTDRIADFQSIFGDNLPWFEGQFLKYMEVVK